MTRAAPARRALADGQRVARAARMLLLAAERSASTDSRLAAALQEPAPRIHEAVSSFLLRLSAIAQLGEVGNLAELVRRAADAAPLFAAAGLATASFRGAVSSFMDGPGTLPAWFDGAASEALVAALYDGTGTFAAPRDLGLVHQELLEISIERLDGASVRIAPSGLWVSLRTLLNEPSATRSRRLQRLAGLPKGDVERLSELLTSASSEEELGNGLMQRLPRRVEQRPEGALVVGAHLGRRSAGAHYTPRAVAEVTLARAFRGLLDGRSAAEIQELRICDPAMGSGDFLRVAADVLASALDAAWTAEGEHTRPRKEGNARGLDAARATIARNCLFGVDRDAVAVDCARWTLGRIAAADSKRPVDLSHSLRVGDALVGSSSSERHATPFAAFDWHDEFAGVFERGGFDACVGNPPWVAYAGRAAQPLASELFAYYEANNAAFFGYRSLHGLFLRRAAEVLRPGGRLGLVLPTSVADLHGYAPARAAHDALCTVDDELTDFGDGAFDGVFQPCMAVTSTRLGAGESAPLLETWRLSRSDMSPEALALLDRLERLPRLDPAHFGERGLQSTGDDLSHMKHLAEPSGRFTLPLREGVDVAEFAAAPPTLFGDPVGLGARVRPAADYARVDVIIRQTARFPIAARSDGVAFRNSLLAGFGLPDFDADALLAYLNSSLVRFFHFARHRDARQGMPQLKIGHLRALPSVPPPARAALANLGRALGQRNRGISASERAELDAVVFDALQLSRPERALVETWTAATPPPRARVRKH